MRFNLKADSQGWLSHPFFLPRKYRFWLADHGSLTRRLKHCCGKFLVKPVRVGLFRPNRDETALLFLRPCRVGYVREVVLHCDGQPVVFAHSAVPPGSLRGPWASVTKLGSRPLGEALFSNPRVLRGDLQYRRIPVNHSLARQVGKAGIPCKARELWARRSLFSLQGHSLLVTEVFLPNILSIKGEGT